MYGRPDNNFKMGKDEFLGKVKKTLPAMKCPSNEGSKANG